MYSSEITTIIQKDPIASKYFKGVTACDNLPSNSQRCLDVKHTCFYIINTAPSHHEGLHWVLLGKFKTKAVFFDSLGKTPFDYGPYLAKFTLHMVKKCTTITWLNKGIQSKDGKFCGIYCIFAAHHLCRNKSINKIIRCFNTRNVERNDNNDTYVLQWLWKKLPTWA